MRRALKPSKMAAILILHKTCKLTVNGFVIIIRILIIKEEQALNLYLLIDCCWITSFQAVKLQEVLARARNISVYFKNWHISHIYCYCGSMSRLCCKDPSTVTHKALSGDSLLCFEIIDVKSCFGKLSEAKQRAVMQCK